MAGHEKKYIKTDYCYETMVESELNACMNIFGKIA